MEISLGTEKGMYFYLHQAKLYVLEKTKSQATNAKQLTEEKSTAILKWEDDDFMCKGTILNSTVNSVYDIYEAKFADGTTKDLWDDLNVKYHADDAKNRKFLASQVYDFKMHDNKSVMSRAKQLLMNQVVTEGHALDESFQVSTIIPKLPYSWKDCRKELKQRKDVMSMQELVQFLQVEKNSRNLDKLELEDKSSKTLIVESASKQKDKKHKFEDGSSSSKKRLDNGNYGGNQKNKAKIVC